jgi:hypothetical protein
MNLSHEHRPRKPSRAVLVAFVAVVIAGVGGGFLASASGSQPAPAANAQRIRSFVRHYSVLRRPRVAGAARVAGATVPIELQNAFPPGPAAARYGLDVSAAGMAQPSSSVSAWLVPGAGGQCVAVQTPDNGAVGCDQRGSGPVTANMLETDGMLVGFVPDGNASVTFASPSGSRVIPVIDNSFEFAPASGQVAAGADFTVRYRDGAGADRVESLHFVGRSARALLRQHGRLRRR